MQKDVKFTPIDILKDRGFKPFSDLNFCTESGVNYYVGYRDEVAAIVAIIEDESIYMIDKQELRSMAKDAKIKGIEKTILYTNYGLELHSKYDKPESVGLSQIIKINSEGYNQFRILAV